MPTKINLMERQIAELKASLKDGQKCSPTGNSIKFDIAWLEQAIEQEKYMAQKMRFDSNLGKRFSTRTFESFDRSKAPEAYDKVLRYYETKAYEREAKNSLLIVGPYGTGKTHLAAAVSNQLVNDGVSVLFDTFSGYIEKLKKEFDIGEHKWLSKMKNVSMLVIDDVGQEKQTEWTMQIMYDVINHRYEAMLPTIITTNLGAEYLEDYLGGATYSRLCEMCIGLVVDGEDQRKE